MNYYNQMFDSAKYGDIHYHETLGPETYFYEICSTWHGHEVDIVVMNIGVSLWFGTKNELVHTNIVPDRLVGVKTALIPADLEKILDVVVSTDGEGKTLTIEDQEIFQEWLKMRAENDS